MAKSKYESSKNAIKRYIEEKTDEVRLRVPKGTKERWKEYAESKGISLTKLVVSVINDVIENDSFEQEAFFKAVIAENSKLNS